MVSGSLKGSAVLIIILVLVVAGVPTDHNKNENEGPETGEVKNPALTRLRDNTLIMKNGIVSNEKQYIENEIKLEKQQRKEQKGEEAEVKHQPSRQDSSDEKLEHKKSPTVSKRFMYDVESSRWDKGIVPYILNESLSEKQVNEIKKTFALYEYWTCLRFPEWDSTTKKKYGLSHNNYLHFITSSGCWSVVTNVRSKSGGQSISCCGGSACVHEVGHALGFHHEQKHPYRDLYVRVNPENIGNLPQYTKSTGEKNLRKDIPYNLNSYMHYQFWMFRKAGAKGETMTLFDPRFRYLIDQHDPTQFYMFKELVKLYRCKELKCPNFEMKCENDGYVSYINNKCQCRCVKGLDPATGCTTLLREDVVEKTISWPKSQFALLRPTNTKCPEDSVEGSITHTSDGGWTSDIYHAEGNHDIQHFCTFNQQTRKASVSDWPVGEYCISRVGGKCPEKECPTGWKYNKNNNHCYKLFVNRAHGIDAARAVCEQQGAYIVSIANKEENDFVYSMREKKVILIGLSDRKKENEWVWEDGTVYVYKNFYSGEPNDYNNNEDCVTLGSYGKWNDLACSSWFTVMCERKHPEFQEGFVEFEDDSVTKTGDLPDVISGTSTKLQFCCRQDGNIANAVVLPTSDKFILWQTNKKGCQAVKDTIAVSNYFAHRMKAGKSVTRSGTTPLSSVVENVGYVYFCAYRPVTRDCGQIIELTDSVKEKTISSPYYPHAYHANMKCTWLIKSPPKTHIVLNFETFEIPSLSDKCEDSLEIRFSFPEHPGVKYCGKGFKSSIYSGINYIVIILNSNAFEKGKRFKATARMVKNEDLCYNVKDYGRSYRGKVSFTRSFKRCLPWSSLTHCPHTPNTDTGDDLVQNYCRNPKSGTQPWCYTDSETCGRDYCDICGIENCYDLLDNCKTLMKKNADYCSDTAKWNGVVGCAKSCGLCDLQTKKKFTEITCSTLTIPAHTVPIDPSVTSVYVGEYNQFKYKTNDYNIFSQTCLGDGTWTKIKECPDGWTLDSKKQKCNKAILQEFLGRYQGDRLCEKYGGYAATIGDEEEQKVVYSLVKETGRNLLLGVDDVGKEGTFVWSDGKTLTYNNFDKGQPDNWNNEDCVDMRASNGKWNDLYCHSKYPGIVCQIDVPVGTCKDGTADCEKFEEMTDVANGKQATQSSDYSASDIADNALNGDWRMGSGCTHTRQESNPWWEVNLESVFTIQKVVLVNRQNSWGSRLRNVVISIGKTQQSLQRCAKYEGPGRTGEIVELRCSRPLPGQFVKVEIQGSGILTLCQVMVYA